MSGTVFLVTGSFPPPYDCRRWRNQVFQSRVGFWRLVFLEESQDHICYGNNHKDKKITFPVGGGSHRMVDAAPKLVMLIIPEGLIVLHSS